MQSNKISSTNTPVPCSKCRYKLVKWIISIIIILVIIWLALTYYSSYVLDKNKDNYVGQMRTHLIDEFNSMKNTHRLLLDRFVDGELDISHIEISPIINYQRGFFSSQGEIDIFDNEHPDHKVQLQFTVYHGPLPINRLSHFNLFPVLLSARVHLVNNDFIAPLFKISSSKLPVELTFNKSYGDGVNGKLNIAPLSYKEDGAVVGFDGGDINFEVGNELVFDGQFNNLYSKEEITESESHISNIGVKAVTFSLKRDQQLGIVIDGGLKQLKVAEADSKHGELTVDNIQYHTDTSSANADKSVKSINFMINGIKLDGDQIWDLPKQYLKLGSISIVGGDTLEDNYWSVNYTMDVKDVDFSGLNLGSLSVPVKLSHIDPQLMDLLKSGAFLDMNSVSEGADILKDLMQNNSMLLDVDPVVWENDIGRSQLSLHKQYKPKSEQAQNEGNESTCDGIKLNIDVSKPMINRVLQMVGMIKEHREMGVSDTQPQTDALLSYIQLMGFIQLDKDRVKSNVVCDNGKLSVNGKELPLSL